MSEGTWTIRPADAAHVQQLVAALGVDEVTASVLVRRGYCEPAAARAFNEGALPGHDPFLLGDTAVAVNPADERYQHLVGQQIRLPLTGRLVPICTRATEPSTRNSANSSRRAPRCSRARRVHNASSKWVRAASISGRVPIGSARPRRSR